MHNEDYADGKHHPAPAAAHAPGDLIIRNQHFPSSHTSNDLWSRLNAEYPPKTMHYEVIAQNSDEVADLQNAPPLAMGTYLVESGQTHLLTSISIYSERGTNTDQMRLLYMNASALLIWKAMGRNPTLVGARHRPPPTALLMYGVPFSE
ncbi:MAG TPA: hypothetical protein VJT08_16025 [Terriglobales bacterium]|nr:hypothetical protein [Acidobacteriaceae bacterium]HKR31990.1 hypothetical protein [Terriglobales bacterium]